MNLKDELFEELLEAKKVFDDEYDGPPVYKDLRWQTHLEGLFVSQLEKLSRAGLPSEAIGEYVLAYFNSGLYSI